MFLAALRDIGHAVGGIHRQVSGGVVQSDRGGDIGFRVDLFDIFEANNTYFAIKIGVVAIAIQRSRRAAVDIDGTIGQNTKQRKSAQFGGAAVEFEG